MTVQPNESTLATQTVLRQTAVTAAAYWTSHIFSPPLLGLVAAVLCGAVAGWGWTAVYALPAVVAPALFVLWLLRAGRVSDIHMNRREERFAPMLVMIGGTVVSLLLLVWGRAPLVFLALAAAQLAQSLIFYVITLRWKISAHAASAAAAAVLAWQLFAPPLLALLSLTLLVCWARLALRRHTPRQVIAGAALGALTMTAVFELSRNWVIG